MSSSGITTSPPCTRALGPMSLASPRTGCNQPHTCEISARSRAFHTAHAATLAATHAVVLAATHAAALAATMPLPMPLPMPLCRCPCHCLCRCPCRCTYCYPSLTYLRTYLLTYLRTAAHPSSISFVVTLLQISCLNALPVLDLT